MQELLGYIANATAIGSIYACVALALSVVYRATGHINFAQGEMAMLSTYLAWTLVAVGMPFWPAFFLTVAIAFVFGWGVQAVFVRPLANHGHLALVATFLGIFIICNSVGGWIWSYETRTFPSPFDFIAAIDTAPFRPHALGVIAVTVSAMLAVYVIFQHTRVGLAMRTSVDNPVSARLSGMPVNRLAGLGWGIAAAIGAVAGMMIAPMVFLDPNMMTGVLLYGLAGALLGGIDNAWGAAVGGVVMALIETLAGAYLVGTELRMTVAFAVLVAVLIVRPAGLFGKMRKVRV